MIGVKVMLAHRVLRTCLPTLCSPPTRLRALRDEEKPYFADHYYHESSNVTKHKDAQRNEANAASSIGDGVLQISWATGDKLVPQFAGPTQKPTKTVHIDVTTI